MTRVRLMVREQGQRSFREVEPGRGRPWPSASAATSEGARMCREGSVEAFEVWELCASFQREWTLRRTDHMPLAAE